MPKFCTIAAALLMLLAVACNTDTRARIIFDNQSACGAIPVTLTETTTREEKQYSVAPGQRLEVVVKPDVYYDYLVDFAAATPPAGSLRCTAVESGKLRVPAGTAQTFRLQAATPTPK